MKEINLVKRMNSVNKTLYIPLYGKAFVSKKGIILKDKKAEEIWEREGFSLKGKSRSRWLAYYMGIRCAVFDDWINKKAENDDNVTIIHIGCGMDSRCERLLNTSSYIYDVDMPDVIEQRKRYYNETDRYFMIGADVRSNEWLKHIPNEKYTIVVMEGVSMYFTPDELKQLLCDLKKYFLRVNILMDCYTTFAAKASKYKNPINDVGVNAVYGIDAPLELAAETGLTFVKEHEMTPATYVKEINGLEKLIFKTIFAGRISRKLYRLYEFKE